MGAKWGGGCWKPICLRQISDLELDEVKAFFKRLQAQSVYIEDKMVG